MEKLKFCWLIGLMVALPIRAETGVTDQEIILGQSAALTGPAAELGKQFRDGAASYFKIVNAAGGINGRQIKLVSLDDGYEPERAVLNTKKLISETKVFGQFGYVGTPTSNAALPLVTEARVPFFGAFTGAESLRTPMNHYVFNVRASYKNETQAIVDFIPAPSAQRLAVIYQNDAYGQAGLTGITEALAKVNLKPAVSASVERNSVDVAKAVETVAKAKPAVLVIISAYASSAAITRAIQRINPDIKIWNVSFVGSQALSAELGESGRGVGISQVVPFPWDGANNIALEHRDAHGLANVSFTSLEGYIAAKALVEGLKKAGKNLTREGFIKALETSGPMNLGGFVLKYTPTDHTGSKFVDLSMIGKAGKFVH